jgi:hypothetical protein
MHIINNIKFNTKKNHLQDHTDRRYFLSLMDFSDKQPTPELGGLMALILCYLNPRIPQKVLSSKEEVKQMTHRTGQP